MAAKSSSSDGSWRLERAADVLAEDLRARILGEGLEPGTVLTTEASLIEEGRFSRGTIRETLRLLEAEGLIVIKRGPHGGIAVGRPDIGQLGQALAHLLTMDQTPVSAFFDVRKLVEPFAARLAAQTADEESIESLRAAIDAAAGNTDENNRFHRVLADCTGNEMVRVIVISLQMVLERDVPHGRLSQETLEDVGVVHGKILDAIRRRDGDRAERLMLRHIEAWEKLLAEQNRLDEPLIPRSAWKSRRRA